MRQVRPGSSYPSNLLGSLYSLCWDYKEALQTVKDSIKELRESNSQKENSVKHSFRLRVAARPWQRLQSL